MKPTYNVSCKQITTNNAKISIDFLIDKKYPKDISVKIINPKNLNIDEIFFSYTSKCLKYKLLKDSIIINPINPTIEQKEKNNLIFIAKIHKNCYDTLMNISTYYNAQLYKRVRFLGRIELGYINNYVSYSDKSSQSNEKYSVDITSGYLFAVEIIEYRATKDLLFFGMNLGFNYKIYYLNSYRSLGNLKQVTANDFFLNVRADLPFYFLSRDLKDLSFRAYLSFPFFQTGYLSYNSNNSEYVYNNVLDLKLNYGFGVNYIISKWFSVEFRAILENYESNYSIKPIGSKINFNVLKSEIVFSIINVYDNLNELLSE